MAVHGPAGCLWKLSLPYSLLKLGVCLQGGFTMERQELQCVRYAAWRASYSVMEEMNPC